jgi:hypothetical protein
VGELRSALKAGVMTAADVHAELGEIVNGTKASLACTPAALALAHLGSPTPHARNPSGPCHHPPAVPAPGLQHPTLPPHAWYPAWPPPQHEPHLSRAPLPPCLSSPAFACSVCRQPVSRVLRSSCDPSPTLSSPPGSLLQSGREGDEIIVCDLTGTGAQDAAIGQVAWEKLSKL